MHTLLQYFCITLYLLENCYMAIAFQMYRRTYTFFMLMLLFLFNTLMLIGAYVLGKLLLGQLAFSQVQLLLMIIVSLVHLLAWVCYGLRQALKGIFLAQCATWITLGIAYTIYYQVN